MKKYFEPEAELLHFRNEQILTESWGVEDESGGTELSIVGGATQSSDSPASELLP